MMARVPKLVTSLRGRSGNILDDLAAGACDGSVSQDQGHPDDDRGGTVAVAKRARIVGGEDPPTVALSGQSGSRATNWPCFFRVS